ncbi:flagellar motor protein MotB [Marinomonas balearica]|uniref:Chemotaxis protein MotB n=1 Tax=Marinomonas balearica TaxID=491947 RepID=A0A4R6MC08_9GAMM|nr:flagellar motor protein MotB [Marinomonas balearica]TDO99014.1 chemotaxis protein MotB [Marinomonas balearica]
MSGEELVIRRIKKVRKGGHHGGAWKIALADFALAMMAFFLVLWIINVASPEELTAIEGYFNDPLGPSTAGFSASPIDLGGSPAKSNERKLDLDLPEPGSTNLQSQEVKRGEGNDGKEIERMNALLEQELKRQGLMDSEESNMRIEITPQGVRITLLDDPTKPMFERGSARLMPDTENVLLSIGAILTELKNPISISGHTDSSPYVNETENDNWDLSSSRANAARKILEEGGVVDKRMAQVIGLADSIPYNRFDPASAENRRISITLLTDEAYKKMLDINRRNFGEQYQQEDLHLVPEVVF